VTSTNMSLKVSISRLTTSMRRWSSPSGKPLSRKPGQSKARAGSTSRRHAATIRHGAAVAVDENRYGVADDGRRHGRHPRQDVEIGCTHSLLDNALDHLRVERVSYAAQRCTLKARAKFYAEVIKSRGSVLGRASSCSA